MYNCTIAQGCKHSTNSILERPVCVCLSHKAVRLSGQGTWPARVEPRRWVIMRYMHTFMRIKTHLLDNCCVMHWITVIKHCMDAWKLPSFVHTQHRTSWLFLLSLRRKIGYRATMLERLPCPIHQKMRLCLFDFPVEDFALILTSPVFRRASEQKAKQSVMCQLGMLSTQKGYLQHNKKMHESDQCNRACARWVTPPQWLAFSGHRKARCVAARPAELSPSPDSRVLRVQWTGLAKDTSTWPLACWELGTLATRGWLHVVAWRGERKAPCSCPMPSRRFAYWLSLPRPLQVIADSWLPPAFEFLVSGSTSAEWLDATFVFL